MSRWRNCCKKSKACKLKAYKIYSILHHVENSVRWTFVAVSWNTSANSDPNSEGQEKARVEGNPWTLNGSFACVVPKSRNCRLRVIGSDVAKFCILGKRMLITRNKQQFAENLSISRIRQPKRWFGILLYLLLLKYTFGVNSRSTFQCVFSSRGGGGGGGAPQNLLSPPK